jgi:hypothetical protein
MDIRPKRLEPAAAWYFIISYGSFFALRGENDPQKTWLTRAIPNIIE